MKKITLVLLVSLFYLSGFAQRDTLRMKVDEIESVFLAANLELLAGQLDIRIAEAAVVQARAWDNPTLSISDLNLWSTASQREGESVFIPPLFGKFARNTQFSVELNQMIQTAGKRRKLVKREQVFQDIALEEFYELLRGLRYELRQAVNELQFNQSYIELLGAQQQIYTQVIGSYEKRVQTGDALRGELLRLRSSALELENELNEARRSYNEQQRILKSLLNSATYDMIWVESSTDTNLIPPAEFRLGELVGQAVENRPDAKSARLLTDYDALNLRYEKSLRSPDVSVGVMYDRRGGVWRDFVGFGVGIDVPIFNRNQGNIRAAQVAGQQSQIRLAAVENSIRNEIYEAYANYTDAYNHYAALSGTNFLSETEETARLYAKYLVEGNVSLLEFIDFMDAHMRNAVIILSARKNVTEAYETLHYLSINQS